MELDRFNYWYRWLIYCKEDIVYPNKETPNLFWTQPRKKFKSTYTKDIEEVDDDKYLKKLDENELDRITSLISVLRKHPMDLKDNKSILNEFFKLMENHRNLGGIYTEHFKKALLAILGDDRGKTSLTRLQNTIKEHLNYYLYIIDERKKNPKPSLEDAIDLTSEAFKKSDETIKEIYKEYHKAYKNLYITLEDDFLTIECMKLMTDIDSSSKVLSKNYHLVKNF